MDSLTSNAGLIAGTALVACAAAYVFTKGGSGSSTSAKGKKSGDFDKVLVGKVSDFAKGTMKEVKVRDQVSLLLVRTTNGQFYATGSKCTHYSVPLAKGVLNGDRIVCPAHGACFNASTGDIEDAPGLDALATFGVVIENDQVYIEVPKTETIAQRRVPKMCPCDASKDKRTILIIGGGPAALVAAQTLRQEGYEGKITIVTKEPHLPYDRVKLSKNFAIKINEILLRPKEFYDDNGITVMTSEEATKVNPSDKTVNLASGKTLSYDKLLLAVGGHARTLPVEGHDLKNIYPLRVAEDSVGVNSVADSAKNVVIIGSSFIGMEAAACLRGKKNIEKIVVVGMEKVPFERVLGAEVGAALQKLHESKGIEFRMESFLDKYIGTDGKVSAVQLKSGETIPCDLVIIGAGIILSTGFLKDDIPLERDGSVVVDNTFKQQEDIYAVGDMARFPYWATGETIRIEHWDVAQQQARIAARNMAGMKCTYESVPMFWTAAYGVSVRYAGNAMSWDRIIIKGDLNALKFVAYYAKGNTVNAAVSIGTDPAAAAVLELIRDRRLPSADELEAKPLEYIYSLIN